MERSISFTVEVIVDRTGKWIGNSVRFATREEADAHALHLSKRWVAVRRTRIVETTDPISHRYIDGNIIPTGVRPFTVSDESNPFFVVRGHDGARRPVITTAKSRAEAEAYIVTKLGDHAVDDSQ